MRSHTYCGRCETQQRDVRQRIWRFGRRRAASNLTPLSDTTAGAWGLRCMIFYDEHLQSHMADRIYLIAVRATVRTFVRTGYSYCGCTCTRIYQVLYAVL